MFESGDRALVGNLGGRARLDGHRRADAGAASAAGWRTRRVGRRLPAGDAQPAALLPLRGGPIRRRLRRLDLDARVRRAARRHPLLLGTVVFAWLIAGEVFGRRRWLQTLSAGVVALNPQLVHLSSVVNPDAMLALFGSAVLYLSVVLVRRGLTRARVGAMVALAAGCALTHPRGPLDLRRRHRRVAIAAWRQRGPHDARATCARRSRAARLPSSARSCWRSTPPAARRRPTCASSALLWQFYLPRLSFMEPSIGPDYGAREAFVERFFGTYGQLDTVLSREVLDLIWIGTLVGLALLVAALVAQRGGGCAPTSTSSRCSASPALLLRRQPRAGVPRALDQPARPGPDRPLPAAADRAAGAGGRDGRAALPRNAGAVAASAALSLALLLQFAALGAVVVRFYG